MTKDISADQIRHLQEHTKLNNNREALVLALTDLIQQILACEKYCQDVIEGKKSGDVSIANQLLAGIGCLKE